MVNFSHIICRMYSVCLLRLQFNATMHRVQSINKIFTDFPEQVELVYTSYNGQPDKDKPIDVSGREGTKVESTHVRIRYCSFLLAIRLLQWQREAKYQLQHRKLLTIIASQITKALSSYFILCSYKLAGECRAYCEKRP